ncbi:MAG: ribosome recycling factor [Planctomycetes bacterium]|nr:ribosome recycling factor [Planctomycetota bacterium]
MPYDDIYLEAQDKMDKAAEVMVNEFKGIRTGRASSGLIEHVRVEYYGAPTQLKAIASISVPDARMLIVKPFDPSSLSNIDKAIQKSDLGLNPQNDGKVLRITIPPLSEDRRKQLVKAIKEITEKAKVAVRNVRRDSNKAADEEKKDSSMTEDENFKLKEEIQKATEQIEKKIDELFDKKSKEIMEV